MHIRRWRFLVLLAAIVVIVAACGGDDDDGGSTESGDGNGNTIAISGSSTVQPISAAVGERFSDANPDVAVSVDGPGTGDGFQLFCSGETDISNASRAIKDEEVQSCSDAGIDYIELQVAIDGISVLTSPTNDAVSCLTFGDMYALVGPESIGFDTWAAANDLAAEVGGTGGFPDAPLAVTAPGEESGTYDTFVEFVIDGIAEERGEDGVARPDYVASPNDNVIIEGIEGSDSSFGWVGFAFYLENQDRVKAIEVDGGDGCVGPTAETIADGSYPLSRPLFIYVNEQRMSDKPVLREFVEFYLSDEGLASVAETGYVELADYSQQRAAIGS